MYLLSMSVCVMDAITVKLPVKMRKKLKYNIKEYVKQSY
jgi:hypothetical protein